MENLWNRLKSNRTIICSAIFILLQQDYVQGFIPDPKLLTFLQWLFGSGGLIALIIHIKNGSFKASTNVNPNTDNPGLPVNGTENIKIN